jgi:hypothetical protein
MLHSLPLPIIRCSLVVELQGQLLIQLLYDHTSYARLGFSTTTGFRTKSAHVLIVLSVAFSLRSCFSSCNLLLDNTGNTATGATIGLSGVELLTDFSDSSDPFDSAVAFENIESTELISVLFALDSREQCIRRGVDGRTGTGTRLLNCVFRANPPV